MLADSPTAAEMAKLRWKGTTKAQRITEMRRVAIEGWRRRPRAKGKKR
jgi:hypothetical protein